MEATVAKLCAHCTALIPPKKEPTSERTHYSNLELLEQSSQNCSLCKLILGDWSLEKAQKIDSTTDSRGYESTALQIKMKEVQSTDLGFHWALLEAEFEINSSKLAFIDRHTITTSNKECT
jgi:hypothetical protein